MSSSPSVRSMSSGRMSSASSSSPDRRSSAAADRRAVRTFSGVTSSPASSSMPRTSATSRGSVETGGAVTADIMLSTPTRGAVVTRAASLRSRISGSAKRLASSSIGMPDRSDRVSRNFAKGRASRAATSGERPAACSSETMRSYISREEDERSATRSRTSVTFFSISAIEDFNSLVRFWASAMDSSMGPKRMWFCSGASN